jgi:serine/threonine protein phosphatase 1
MPFGRHGAQICPPRVPEGVRLYVIGDIHGCAKLLDQAFARIDAHLVADPVVRPIEIFLGDYVDRGPASRSVLNRLIARGQQSEMICLKGNHETYMESFPDRPSIWSEWRHNGGFETLMSYGLAPSMRMSPDEEVKLGASFAERLPEAHRRFLKNLLLSFTCGDYFFVHAGVRPGVSLREQREDDLLWIREDFLFCEEPFGKTIVHGHTPVRQPEIKSNRINIDTGAYATGQLTCLVLERERQQFV